MVIVNITEDMVLLYVTALSMSMTDNSLVKGVELDLGPEWVLWLHTGCSIKNEG